jgi:hypothetical protein
VRYLDVSSLVALYYPEAKTVRLEAHLRRRHSRLPFTWLHELELTNKEFITSDQRQSDLAARDGLKVVLIL